MHISKVKDGWYMIPKKDFKNPSGFFVIQKRGVKYKILETLEVNMPFGKTKILVSEGEDGKYTHVFSVDDSVKINRQYSFVSLSMERKNKIKSLI